MGTPYYNLNKPVRGEKDWDVQLNQNFDIIDTELKAKDDEINEINSKIDPYLSDISIQYSNTFSSELISKMQNSDLVKIICFGDSWTSGDAEGMYPSILQDKLRQFFNNNNITVINEGHSGWTTTNAVGYIDNIVSQTPDIVFMMFGINDADTSLAINTYKSNLKSMVKTMRTAGIEVILMTPGTTLVTSFNKKLMYYCSAVREIAQYYNIGFVDIYNELLKRIFFSRQVVPKDVIPDNYHLAGVYRSYCAEIIMAKMLKNNIPTVESTDDFSMPLWNSPYVNTNITTYYMNNTLFYKYYYSMAANDGTYLRFAFYMNVPGMSLVARSPKNGACTSAQVYMDGILVKTIRGKANDGTICDASEVIYNNISIGYHYIEISAENVVSNIFLGEFQFTKTITDDIKSYNNATGGTLGTIERFKPVLDGNIKYTGITSQNSGVIFFDGKHLELTPEKTLVIEIHAKIYSGSGFTWFGHRAESYPVENNPSGVNFGYAILGVGSDVTLYVAGVNNVLNAVWSGFGVMTDYTNYHTFRIEMTSSYGITFFIDGVQAFTTTDTGNLINDGWCGILTTDTGTIYIDRWEYFYK